jgi:hypothetical protein
MFVLESGKSVHALDSPNRLFKMQKESKMSLTLLLKSATMQIGVRIVPQVIATTVERSSEDVSSSVRDVTSTTAQGALTVPDLDLPELGLGLCDCSVCRWFYYIICTKWYFVFLCSPLFSWLLPVTCRFLRRAFFVPCDSIADVARWPSN